MEEVVNPPRTIMEVFQMLPEGTLAEVIENTLYMSPTPITNHQRIIRKLSVQIDLHLTANNLGELFFAPFDVFLDKTSNAVQPDILVILTENLGIIDEKSTIHGVPDLIVEILSPGNRKHDLVIKRALYEKFGVKEYWVIDPATKESIGFSLKDHSYVEFYKGNGEIHSQLLNRPFIF